MKKVFLLYLFVTSIVGTFFLFTNFASAEEKPEEKPVLTSLPQIIKSISTDGSFNLAGETLPKTFDVRERLDRELSVNAYWHSSTLINLKNASRYFPIIQRILAENGVPDDFKFLAVAESNLRNVVSSANAKGYWQFRKLAAKEFDLEVNDEVDERYHIEKSTEAAAKYLKQLHKRFGTWTDAAAAYNMGPTNYSRIKRNQKESSYYNLNLGDESSRYVFRLVAMKEIMTNPDVYGFYLENGDKYHELPAFYEVKVDASVSDWGDWAHKYGLTYRELKIYNPWLIDTKLTVINNTYYIKLPRKNG